MTEELKVFENLYDIVQEFENKEEFQRYYNKNKEAIDKMPTRGLNVRFKINGYKLGKQKGELMLYPAKVQTDTKKEEQSKALEDKVEKLSTLVNAINEKLQEDMKMINVKLQDLNDRLFDIEEMLQD